MRVDELRTPCLVVDLGRLERNLAAWQAAIDAHGCRFRPHVKTHKTLEIARMQLAAGAAGITASKASEASVYVAAGFDDVVVAYPVAAPAAWEQLAELASRARVAVNVENEHAAHGLSRAAAGRGVELGVYLDVDIGMHRCGVPVGDVDRAERLTALIRRLPGLGLRGVTGYRSISGNDARASGLEEGARLVELAARLGVDEVAAGSTPTGRFVAEVDGVTEVRAGVYPFNDLMQERLGVAGREEISLSIRATVVSTGAGGRVTVDAGSKTFSGDAVLEGPDGRIVAESADRSVVIEWMSEEHGIGRASRPVEIGERIAFHPAHVCTTVNLSDELVAARGGEVEAIWPVVARGART
jgi:D-serine deaminase-like pyridoxal phosphate-dependent protein